MEWATSTEEVLSMIQIKGLSKAFKENVLFRNVGLEVEKGETIGIIGGNGSGKSVLFNMIAGVVPYKEGEITVDGKVIGKDVDFPENCGVYVNAPGWVNHYTGYKNLYYLAIIRNVIGEEEIKDIMRRFGLDPENKTRVGKYSQGMKQKLGIAQAIMENQELLILDEPFNALDHETYHEIHEQLKRCKSEGKTILLTSHNQEDIKSLCDRVYIIHDKQVLPLTDELERLYFRR